MQTELSASPLQRTCTILLVPTSSQRRAGTTTAMAQTGLLLCRSSSCMLRVRMAGLPDGSTRQRRLFPLLLVGGHLVLLRPDRRAGIPLPGVEGRPAFGVSLGKCSGVSADVNSSWEDGPLCNILPLVPTTFSLIHNDPPLFLLWLLRDLCHHCFDNDAELAYVATWEALFCVLP